MIRFALIHHAQYFWSRWKATSTWIDTSNSRPNRDIQIGIDLTDRDSWDEKCLLICLEQAVELNYSNGQQPIFGKICQAINFFFLFPSLHNVQVTLEEHLRQNSREFEKTGTELYFGSLRIAVHSAERTFAAARNHRATMSDHRRKSFGCSLRIDKHEAHFDRYEKFNLTHHCSSKKETTVITVAVAVIYFLQP